MQKRLFFAVHLSPEVNLAVGKSIEEIQSRMSEINHPLKANWIPAENLHLTLKFLGNTEVAAVPEIIHAVGLKIQSVCGFEISCQGIGAFPNMTSPRVIWAGIRDGSSSLRVLSSSIDEAVVPFGFEKEKRDFTPHLTLARVKSGRNILPVVKPFLSADWGSSRISEVALLESKTLPTGSVYHPFHIFKLK